MQKEKSRHPSFRLCSLFPSIAFLQLRGRCSAIVCPLFRKKSLFAFLSKILHKARVAERPVLYSFLSLRDSYLKKNSYLCAMNP